MPGSVVVAMLWVEGEACWVRDLGTWDGGVELGARVWGLGVSAL